MRDNRFTKTSVLPYDTRRNESPVAPDASLVRPNVAQFGLTRRRLMQLTGEVRRQVDHYGQRAGRGRPADGHGQQQEPVDQPLVASRVHQRHDERGLQHRAHVGRDLAHARPAVQARGHQRVDAERQAQREHEPSEVRHARPQADLQRPMSNNRG